MLWERNLLKHRKSTLFSWCAILLENELSKGLPQIEKQQQKSQEERGKDRNTSLLDAVVDHFGTGADVFYRPDGDSHFVVSTDITISDQFFGWIAEF